MINLTASIENNRKNNDTIWSCLTFLLRNVLKNTDSVKRAGIIALFGLGYGCFADITGISVPCPIRYFTGVLCPGCGITTFFLSLAQGDLNNAKQANAFIFYTLPLFIAFYYLGAVGPHSRVSFLVNRFFMPLYLAALIAFGIYRNI